MRILHTIDSLAPEKGGTSRSVPRLTQALAHAGVEVELASGPDWSSVDRRAAAPFDVIHDHGVWLPSNRRSSAMAHARHVPFVLSPRGMLEPWSLRHHRLKKRLAWALYQRRVVQRAALLHATSAMEAENLRRLGLRQPIAVIGNGVDIPAAAPHERAKGDARVALFLSRIHPKKGLLDLVAAWNRVRPAGWRAVIVGPNEGDHERDVRAAIAAASLDDCFSFAGEADDVTKWSWYAAADVFVLPSYSENFGTVVAEALASGVPVITTTATPWSVLATENCGWWIEPQVDALAAALAHATSLDDAHRRAMGARGRALVETRFSWQRAGSDMRGAYEWLLGGGAPPAYIDL